MLIDLDLQTLQDRRKDKRLCFLYNISKKVPAIPESEFLIPVKNKIKIKAKTYDN